MAISNDRFARNLVKGKIAETVFAQMLRETGKFTVLEFGYEKVMPELLSRHLQKTDVEAIKNIIRHAPDFAVIDIVERTVRLIEVKYMHALDREYVLEDARRMQSAWNPSYLFVATLDGFFFDGIGDIIDKQGEILPLVHPHIPAELQDRYLQILRDFEQ